MRRHQDRSNADARRDQVLQIVIIMVCLGIGGGSVILSTVFPAYAQQIERGINTSILALSLSTLLYLMFRINTYQAEFSSLRRLVHVMQDDLALVTAVTEKNRKLQDLTNRTIRKTGLRLLHDYIDMFEVGTEGFRLRDEKWSLHFNQIFWRDMFETSRGGLTVLVTHTSSVRDWIGVEAELSLIQQRDFIEKGNRIIRMFLHHVPEERHSIPMEYSAVMDEMKTKYEIETVYVPVVHPTWPPMPDATWVPERDIFMTWIGKSLDEFVIGGQPDDLLNFKEMWTYYFERSLVTCSARPALPLKVRNHLRRRH